MTYANSDTVGVKTADMVTVSAGAKAYNLNIAGAKVAETDFVFGSGSLLKKRRAAHNDLSGALAGRCRRLYPAATGGGGGRRFTRNISAAGRPAEHSITLLSHRSC